MLKITILTSLTIATITAKDNGIYSCQGLYRHEKVISRNIESLLSTKVL